MGRSCFHNGRTRIICLRAGAWPNHAFGGRAETCRKYKSDAIQELRSGVASRSELMSLSRRYALSLVALGLTLPSTSARGQTSDAAKRFIGTWRLVSIANANGEKDPLRGGHPKGLIIYDAYGDMAVQIMPDRERPKFAVNKATPEEAQAALLGYTAYFGTYSVDPVASTVTHHRQGNINAGAIGDYVRGYEFIGDDKLILRPLETQNRLTWERVK